METYESIADENTGLVERELSNGEYTQANNNVADFCASVKLRACQTHDVRMT